MAKFCIYCGKPLAEGKSCDCADAQAAANASDNNAENVNETVGNTNTTNSTSDSAGQQEVKPNETVEKIKEVFGQFGNILKSPVKTAKEFAAKNDKSYGIIMIVSNLIVMFIMMLILCNSSANALSNSVPLLGNIVSTALSSNAFSISLMVVIIGAASFFITAAMLVLSTKSIFKGNMNFNQAVSIVGINAFLSMVIDVVAIFLMLASAVLGIIVLYIGILYAGIAFLVTYIEMVDIPSDKKVLALLITIILSIIAMVIVVLIVGAIFGSSFISSYDNVYDYSDFDF
jgi:hypothetical protein